MRGLLRELVEGTIDGIETWRQIHETGEIPPEFKELDEQAKRGWPRGARRRQVNDPGNGCGNTRNRGRNLTTSPAAKTAEPGRQGPPLMIAGLLSRG